MKKMFTRLVIACFVMFLTFNAFAQKKEGNNVLNNPRSFFGAENRAMNVIAADPPSDMRAIISKITKSNGTTSSQISNALNGMNQGGQKWNGHSRLEPDTAWTKSFDGGGDDEAFCTRQTSDGGYIIAGRTNGIGSGDYDGWIIKTDQSGNIVWSKTYGDSYVDEIHAIKQTSDGGYIACGTSTAFGWGFEGWIMKIDNSGNMIWSHGYHPMMSTHGDTDLLYDVEEMPDGNFIAVGFGNLKDYMWQAWIEKVSSSGVEISNHVYGDEYWERLYRIIPTSDGNYVAVGDKHATYDSLTADTIKYCHDGWLVKFNSNGDTLWTNHFGTEFHDMFRSVKQTSDGGYIICGERQINDQIGYKDWVVRTDGNGQKIWEKIFEPGAFEDVQITPAGNYLFAGETYSPQTAFDGLLIETDANGDVVWEKNITAGYNDDMFASLNKVSDGGYILAGRTNSPENSNVWLVKLGSEGPVPVTSLTENFDEVTTPFLPENWTADIQTSLSNTIADVSSTLHGMAPSTPNVAFIMNGLDGSNGQLDTHAFVALVSPYVQVGENGSSLTFKASGGNPIIVGTMTNPSDTTTFIPLQQFDLTAASFTECSLMLTTPGNTYLAFKHGNTTTCTPVFVDDIAFAPVIPHTPVTNLTENFDEVTTPFLPENWTADIQTSLSNTIADVSSTLHGMAPSVPNVAFIMNGLDGSNGQLDIHAFVALVSPYVQVGETGSTLTFKASGGNPIIIGTMTNPSDTTTFIPLQQFDLTAASFTECSLTLNTPGNTYLAFKHGNVNTCTPVFVDDITFAPVIPHTPVTNLTENFDEVTTPFLPEDWTADLQTSLSNTIADVSSTLHGMAPSTPNVGFIMNGLDGSNGQLDTHAFVALVSPYVQVGETGSTLTFKASGGNPIIIGTMTNPSDTTTFIPLQQFDLTAASFTECSLTLTTPGNTYLAFRHGNVNTCTPVFVDDITFAPVIPHTPVTNLMENFDEVTTPFLPEDWTADIQTSLSNTIADVSSTLHGMAPSTPNVGFIMNGLDGSTGQLDTHAFVALVSPYVQVGETGSTLTFKASGGNPIIVGTMTNPSDTTTFIPLQQFDLTAASFTECSLTLNTPGNTYLAFKHGNVNTCTPVFVDDITFAPVIPHTPVTNLTENFDEVTTPFLPEDWTADLQTSLSNTIADVSSTLHGMAPSTPNVAFIMNGLDGSNGQLDTHAFVALVSPYVQVGENGSSLTFKASGGNPIIVGTMTNPSDTTTFIPLQQFDLTAASFTECSLMLTTPGNSYLAFKHGNVNTCTPVFVDDITFAPISNSPVITIANIENVNSGTITVPVHATNVVNMGSFQFTIEYDPALMAFSSASDWYTGIDAITIGEPTPGHLTFVWAADLQGINIADGTFFNLNFNWFGSGSTSAVNWSDNPTPREFADYDGNIFVPTYNNGSVTGTPSQSVLSVTPANQDVTSTAGTTTFTVANTGTGTMNYTATVITGNDWLTITSGASGINSGTIEVSYTENAITSPRVATITVTAPGATGSPVQVTVTQAANPGISPVLTIGTLTNVAAGLITVPIHATNVVNMGSFQFTIEYDPALMTFSNASDWYTGIEAVTMGEPTPGHLTFVWAADLQGINIADGTFFNLNFNWLGSTSTSPLTWSDNPTPREFTDYDGNVFVSVYNNGSVTGSPSQPILTVTPTNQDVTSVAGTTSFAVANTGIGTMNYTAAVTTGNDWLTITSGGSGVNVGNIEVSFTENTSTSPRTGVITVTAPGANGSPVNVTVTQAAAPAPVATVTITDTTTLVSGLFVVPVHAENITNMGSFQFTIEYDPSIILFDSITNWHAGIDAVTTGNPSAGHITFVWAADLNGINIADGNFFDINFDWIASDVIQTQVNWSDNPTPREFADYDGNIFVPVYNNGTETGPDGIPEIGYSSIKIFPNPATDVVNITVSNDISTVQVMNYLGVIVYSENITQEKTITLNTSRYSAGNYLVRFVTNSGQTLIKKMVIIK